MVGERNTDGRFAPSPTGPLHLGNLRTALLAWLCSPAPPGRVSWFGWRTWTARGSAKVWRRRQLDDLRALGLDWDGPVLRQSERMELYEEAISQLDAEGMLYPCYCTRAEIRSAASAPHGISASDRYPGTCRELTKTERAEREAAGRPPALRVRSGERRISFTDRLLGPQEYPTDDFAVRRNDGTPSYQFAVVVDDVEQGIGEVVRGDDLIDSTPRQILLARLLGLEAPRYAHVPLVLGPDGQRLAKRHGAVTLADRTELGEEPFEVLGWMASSLGLAEPGETPSLEELLSRFDAKRPPMEPTIWPYG